MKKNKDEVYEYLDIVLENFSEMCHLEDDDEINKYVSDCYYCFAQILDGDTEHSDFEELRNVIKGYCNYVVCGGVLHLFDEFERELEECLKDIVEDDECDDDECGDDGIVSDLIDMIIETSRPPVVKRIISSEPATTIIWEDKTKTTVKCMETDTFDVEKGVMTAYLTKLLGKTELKKLLDSVEFQEKVIRKNRKKPVSITIKKRKAK